MEKDIYKLEINYLDDQILYMFYGIEVVLMMLLYGMGIRNFIYIFLIMFVLTFLIHWLVYGSQNKFYEKIYKVSAKYNYYIVYYSYTDNISELFDIKKCYVILCNKFNVDYEGNVFIPFTSDIYGRVLREGVLKGKYKGIGKIENRELGEFFNQEELKSFIKEGENKR